MHYMYVVIAIDTDIWPVTAIEQHVGGIVVLEYPESGELILGVDHIVFDVGIAG